MFEEEKLVNVCLVYVESDIERGQNLQLKTTNNETIRLATAVTNLETRKEILGHPVKVNVLDVLRNVKLVI